MSWVDVVKLFHAVWIPIFLVVLIWRTNMQRFREFIDALHSPGMSIICGFALLLIGFVMMKVMLYDDGKYIVGAGTALIIKSLDGKTPAMPGTSSESTINATKE